MSELLLTDLGHRIRTARREAGFTGEEFCVRMGISYSTLQRWETGKNELSIRKLRSLAALTGRPLSYFLDGEEG